MPGLSCLLLLDGVCKTPCCCVTAPVLTSPVRFLSDHHSQVFISCLSCCFQGLQLYLAERSTGKQVSIILSGLKSPSYILKQLKLKHKFYFTFIPFSEFHSFLSQQNFLLFKEFSSIFPRVVLLELNSHSFYLKF